MRKEIKLTKSQVKEILSVSSTENTKKKNRGVPPMASIELFNSSLRNFDEKMCTLSEKRIENPNNGEKFLFPCKVEHAPKTRKMTIDENCLTEMNLSKDSMNILEILQPQTSCDQCENEFYNCINCNMANTYKAFIHDSFESQNLEFDDNFRGIKDESFDKTILNFDQIIPDDNTTEDQNKILNNGEQYVFFSSGSSYQ